MRGGSILAKKKKRMAEFRYYRMPEGRMILALLGEKWVQNYGRDIDYLHFHNYMEIGYCYEGEGIITLGEEDFRFRGGEFTVIPKNYLHTTNSDPGNMSRWEYLFVDLEGLMNRMCAGKQGRAEQMIRLASSRAVFAEKGKWPGMAAEVKKVMDIMREGKEFYQEEAEGLVASFLAQIARENTEHGESGEYQKSEEGGSKLNHLMSHILDYITDHYSEPIKVSDIAKSAHMSETHFRRTFSSYMNMSPLDYINLVRIQSACEYLKKTDEPVSVIAGKCGFTTNSTFNRNFRQVMGTTPVEWRKRPENYEQQILKFDIHSEEGW